MALELDKLEVTVLVYTCTMRIHVPLAEFMYLVFTHMPGKICRWRLGSLLACVHVTSFEH